MGPRKQGLNRSTGKAAQGGANKNKQPKSLKNKLRDVQRLLKKSDLPATVRVIQERMLEVLKETIKDKAKEDKEKIIIQRCKKVKFFEKRKLFRKYKTCLRELKECSENEERNALRKELEEIKLQWNYVIHFPQDVKYISLFPATSYTNVEVLQKQEQILKDISEKIAIGQFEDASETIGQMGKGFKQTTAGKPKSMEGKTKQVEQERKEESEDETPPKVNLDDDFFIDTSPSTEPPTFEEESRKKKKKTNKTRKRSQFKFEKK
ncbi:unnamed protein product [Porites lobata]|uniref:rRNA-processing protein EFG1 n=2 Tax=Porites TaxID=46719 RepID=A0ABN8R4W3_9CNID|nr:unnamed protein product [Porites lobata]